jgi:hypothetical protein
LSISTARPSRSSSFEAMSFFAIGGAMKAPTMP